MSSQLTPPVVEAAAQSRKWLPFGFAFRFFLMFGIGFVWLIPAWWQPRLIGAMFIWDALLLLAWLFDLMRLPGPRSLTVSRSFGSPLALGRPAPVLIQISSTSSEALWIAAQDEAPAALCDPAPILSGALQTQPLPLQYEVNPKERGAVGFGRVFLRYRSPLAFAERWAYADLHEHVSVYPDLVQAREQSLYLIRSRQQQIEKRQHRLRGVGREFESLREYRQGDELRDVSWSATARRHALITRMYTVERSQTIWIVVDAGRLMRAHIQHAGTRFTKLDYAVNAALAVAQIAEQSGDRVGLLAYGRSIQKSIPPAHGRNQLRLFIDALANVQNEGLEADHARAATTLLHRQSRRALIIWITDFAETPALPDVIEYASHVGRRHLVLFAAISQPDLARVAYAMPESESEMFRQAAALEIVDRRQLLLRQLRQRGVLAMDLSPAQFTSSLVNQYLEIKDRALI